MGISSSISAAPGNSNVQAASLDVRAVSLGGGIAAAPAALAGHCFRAGPWPAVPAVWAAGMAAGVASPRARFTEWGRLDAVSMMFATAE